MSMSFSHLRPKSDHTEEKAGKRTSWNGSFVQLLGLLQSKSKERGCNGDGTHTHFFLSKFGAEESSLPYQCATFSLFIYRILVLFQTDWKGLAYIILHDLQKMCLLLHIFCAVALKPITL